ncbi:rod shape-determining protein RodA [Methylophilaceae bacterium]|jgi:rod shape determining protein RodA|nr:rod shape-determining protein RodA [Methylophilaceae bacterium]|tara:strand:+ start:521 stop:1615 length:1095 start_codon:yes stop_codon:yes gene_type:complete
MNKFIPYRLFKNIDKILMSLLLLLLLIGLITLTSASQQDFNLIGNQIINILIGMGLLIILSLIDPKRFLFYAPYLYLISLILLLFVAFFGFQSHGAKRWINILFFNLQPSEIIKISIPLMLAWLYHRFQNKINYKTHTLAFFILLVPCVMILKQPDLGTAILISLAGFIIIFLAGLSLKFIAISGFGIFLALPYLWSNLHLYQQNRILSLIDPGRDPLGTGYHSIQSMIAIGSGGFLGKGWSYGGQTQLDFLPETSTDFIFSVFGEEFGFIGIIGIFIIYFCILYRCVYMAQKMQNTFSRLITASLVFTLFSSIFVNIAMVSGLTPIVGAPLPFISYGGTSMVVSLAMIGIIMSLHFHKSLIAN